MNVEISVWGLSLVHKTKGDCFLKHHKNNSEITTRQIKTVCNRSIILQEDLNDENFQWAKENGKLCKRCFA